MKRGGFPVSCLAPMSAPRFTCLAPIVFLSGTTTFTCPDLRAGTDFTCLAPTSTGELGTRVPFPIPDGRFGKMCLPRPWRLIARTVTSSLPPAARQLHIAGSASDDPPSPNSLCEQATGRQTVQMSFSWLASAIRRVLPCSFLHIT